MQTLRAQTSCCPGPLGSAAPLALLLREVEREVTERVYLQQAAEMRKKIAVAMEPYQTWLVAAVLLSESAYAYRALMRGKLRTELEVKDVFQAALEQALSPPRVGEPVPSIEIIDETGQPARKH